MLAAAGNGVEFDIATYSRQLKKSTSVPADGLGL